MSPTFRQVLPAAAILSLSWLAACDSGTSAPVPPAGTWEAVVPLAFDTTIASTGATYHVEVSHRIRVVLPAGGGQPTFSRAQEGFFTFAAPGGSPSGTVPIDLNVRMSHGSATYSPPTIVIAGDADQPGDLVFRVSGTSLAGQTSFILPRSGFTLGPHTVSVTLAPVP